MDRRISRDPCLYHNPPIFVTFNNIFEIIFQLLVTIRQYVSLIIKLRYERISQVVVHVNLGFIQAKQILTGIDKRR